MSVIDEITQAVAGSAKLDAGTKAVLTEFLQTAGPALATLAPAALQEVMQHLAGGDASAAVPLVAESLTQEQVVAALDDTAQAMDAALAQRQAQVAASRAALAAVQNAAVSILARLVISVL